MRKITPIILGLLSILFAGSICAQEPTPGTKWKLDKVEIAGLKLQKQEEILALVGLQSGQTVDLDSIKAASTKLANTGLFKKVAFRYRYSDKSIEVTFDVEEAKSDRLNCVFDNFVWFGDQEIHEAIKKELPDFDGTASQGDFVIGKIIQTLAQLLREKRIEGEVIHDLNMDVSSGRSENIFKVKDANLKICSIQLVGATVALLPVLKKEVQPITKTEFSRMETGLFAKAALIPVYRQQGYLKALFKPAQAQLGMDGECKRDVVVTLPVEEGPQFRWDKALWEGSRVLSPEELDAAMAMKSGSIADESKISRGFGAIVQAYGKKGHMRVGLKPTPLFDDEKRMVSYQVSVEEGPQYRMGQVHLSGLPEDDIKKLLARWKLKPGEIFDSSYPSELLMKASREGALSSLSVTKVQNMEFKPDHLKLTVDVIIQFK